MCRAYRCVKLVRNFHASSVLLRRRRKAKCALQEEAIIETICQIFYASAGVSLVCFICDEFCVESVVLCSAVRVCGLAFFVTFRFHQCNKVCLVECSL